MNNEFEAGSPSIHTRWLMEVMKRLDGRKPYIARTTIHAGDICVLEEDAYVVPLDSAKQKEKSE